MNNGIYNKYNTTVVSVIYPRLYCICYIVRQSIHNIQNIIGQNIVIGGYIIFKNINPAFQDKSGPRNLSKNSMWSILELNIII